VQGWGKTVILGTDAGAAPVSISSSDIKRGRSVTGALLGGIKPKDDIPVLAHKYLDKVIVDRPLHHTCMIPESPRVLARVPNSRSSN
jgi:Zn-dependent alcohol dehydrogenase